MRAVSCPQNWQLYFCSSSAFNMVVQPKQPRIIGKAAGKRAAAPGRDVCLRSDKAIEHRKEEDESPPKPVHSFPRGSLTMLAYLLKVLTPFSSNNLILCEMHTVRGSQALLCREERDNALCENKRLIDIKIDSPFGEVAAGIAFANVSHLARVRFPFNAVRGTRKRKQAERKPRKRFPKHLGPYALIWYPEALRSALTYFSEAGTWPESTERAMASQVLSSTFV